MADQRSDVLLRHIRRLAGAQKNSSLPDTELLRHFITERDEVAFATLVRRHGAMVLGVCRSVLHQRQDAEDVFQATFLVLARKAGSIRKREALASWLHGVARRLALKVRARAARRPTVQQSDLDLLQARPMDDLTWRELRVVLHEELPRTCTIACLVRQIFPSCGRISSQRLLFFRSCLSFEQMGGIVHATLFVILLCSGPLLGSLNESLGGELERPGVAVEEVHFRHGDNVLAGSLFFPELAGTHPAVVLVLGSGAQDRSYGGAGTALGKHFASHGFVCLAWDKPGVGKSTGDYNAQTFRDRAEEALAAIRFLRARSDVRRDRIGIWGHSQGGAVAPLAASLADDVAFLIEVSGWQGPAWRQDLVRVEAELRADGFAEADIRDATAFARKRMDLIRGTGPFEELDKAQDAVKMFSWFEHVHRCDQALFYSARRNVDYDNGTSWEKVRCPVLVIYGDKDTSSGPPEELVAILRRGLTKAGNRDVTVRIFHNADHSLCKSETGSRTEQRGRAQLRKKEDGPDFVPGYLDTMTTWLDKRFGC